MAPLAASILASALAVVPTMELALASSLAASIRTIATLSGKSVAIIKNANISDHWKEKILPTYALSMFRKSVWVLILLILLAGVFAMGLYAGGWLFADRFEGFLVLERANYQLSSLVIAMAYLLCRRSLARVRLFQT